MSDSLQHEPSGVLQHLVRLNSDVRDLGLAVDCYRAVATELLGGRG